jgi:hypothetical protein
MKNGYFQRHSYTQGVNNILSIEFCTLRLVFHSNIVKTGENRELVLLEKTLGYLDRNASTRNQNVWEFPFNLIWTLSIIAIMDSRVERSFFKSSFPHSLGA